MFVGALDLCLRGGKWKIGSKNVTKLRVHGKRKLWILFQDR
jgi:hypothetical protein